MRAVGHRVAGRARMCPHCRQRMRAGAHGGGVDERPQGERTTTGGTGGVGPEAEAKPHAPEGRRRCAEATAAHARSCWVVDGSASTRAPPALCFSRRALGCGTPPPLHRDHVQGCLAEAHRVGCVAVRVCRSAWWLRIEAGIYCCAFAEHRTLVART